MVDVLTEIEIKSPVERVSEYAANPDNAPEWYVNIDSAEWLTEKPLNLGSKIAFKAKFLGRELAYIYEIVEYVPGRKMVMQTSEGPFPMKTTYTWNTVDSNTTRMTLTNQGEPSGFSKLVSPFMASMMKKANMKDLRNLKEILEG
ncbi:SRPBCC family protein [Bacillus sp. ISL-37]|uniref:SRPBCC family protein n=1 Tax=Bacillus sp. ISL-37 TaxID=2819123 RepID=UPI001BE7255D|nr:SRPBCC family protein [Bacillus sp. ISL-37]MBT2685113.1 SRPBCC family protein [Bacillus sp. ISL-37]